MSEIVSACDSLAGCMNCESGVRKVGILLVVEGIFLCI